MTTPPNRPVTRSPNGFRRYGIAVSGALAATCVAGNGEAAIIYTDNGDVTANAGESLFFNFASGQAESAVTPAGSAPPWPTSVTPDYAAWRIGNYFDGYDDVFINQFASNKKTTAKKGKGGSTVVAGDASGTNAGQLLSGAPIGAAQFPGVDEALDLNDVGDWDGGGTGFLGLRMIDPSSGPDLFGWARVTYDDASNQLTLHDFAYEDGGAAITAGAGAVVPEPASLALLAMGVAGLGVMRATGRRKGHSTGDE